MSESPVGIVRFPIADDMEEDTSEDMKIFRIGNFVRQDLNGPVSIRQQ
jgi:hypothetical protein